MFYLHASNFMRIETIPANINILNNIYLDFVFKSYLLKLIKKKKKKNFYSKLYHLIIVNN